MTYKVLEGQYMYDDGSQGYETSFLVNNISKDVALELVRKVNQETILWKDDTFFGYIYVDDGRPDLNFSRDKNNMESDIQQFVSRLKSKHNESQGFTFKVESFRFDKSKSKKAVDEIFPVKVKEC